MISENLMKLQGLFRGLFQLDMADLDFGGSVTVAGSSTGDLSDLDLYIDEYAGEVEKRFVKKSIMRQFVPVKPVRGTDTITNDVMGL